MDATRDNQEKEGVTELSRIVSKPNPVAYLSLQIILLIDYYVQVIFSIVVSVLMLYKLYLYTYPV